MSSLGYGCAGDDCRNPVNWLLTHMNPPGTLSVCDDHAPVFMIGLLAGVLGVDNARLYDVIRKHVDREAKRQAGEKTELDKLYERLREKYGDLCPECGIAWEQPSPNCPHMENNVHPLAESVAP